MPHEPQTLKLHDDLLVLLKDFHDFCMQNNIKYSLHGGTLLGAIREKGFVPWDDDADVTFTREEFEHFKTVLKNNKSLNFDLEYRAGWNRVSKRGKNGYLVWIDLLIYDYISENYILQKLKILSLILLRAWAKTSDDVKLSEKNYKGIRLLGIKLVYMSGVLFSPKFKLKVAEMVYKSFPGKRKYIQRANDQYVALPIILPVSAMEKYEMIEFEGEEFMISSDYDLILLTSYGDNYMIPQKYENDVNSHLT